MYGNAVFQDTIFYIYCSLIPLEYHVWLGHQVYYWTHAPCILGHCKLEYHI